MIPGAPPTFFGKIYEDTVTFTDFTAASASQTTYTFSSRSFGTYKPGRLIVVCVCGNRDVGGTVSSATIGGVSASIHRNNSKAYGSMAIISAAPTSDTGSVSITWSVLQAGTSIKVYSLYMTGDTVEYASLGGYTTVPTTGFTASPVARSCIISHATNLGGSGIAFGGTISPAQTENSDTSFTGNSIRHACASRLYETATSGTITATPNSSSIPGYQYAIFKAVP